MNLDINPETRKQHLYTAMYLKRLFSLRQMDLDYSFTQMIQICTAPTKVWAILAMGSSYKMTAWRKQTRNQWARDDPSFILITLFFVSFVSVAYSWAIRPWCFSCIVKSVIQGVFFSLLGGLLIATIIWYLVNQYMRIQRPHSPEQSVEWLYAVDIHFNSFFPVVLLVGILQYILLPFLVRKQFLATFVADAIWILAIGYYFYITFLGYTYLPFVKAPFVFLVVGGILSLVVLVFLCFGSNITRHVLISYFSKCCVC